MFEKETRYISKIINDELPEELILEIWKMIDEMEIIQDYCQMFKITNILGQVTIVHTQDTPQYSHTKNIKLSSPIALAMKIYVIDDGTHSTMILIDKY